MFEKRSLLPKTPLDAIQNRIQTAIMDKEHRDYLVTGLHAQS